MGPLRGRVSGLAREFALARFGAPTHPIEGVVTLQGAQQAVVGNNPDRFGLTIINTGNQTAFLSLTRNLTTSGMQPLAPGGSIILTVEEDGDIVTLEWVGTWNGVATTLYVLEEEAV